MPRSSRPRTRVPARLIVLIAAALVALSAFGAVSATADHRHGGSSDDGIPTGTTPSTGEVPEASDVAGAPDAPADPPADTQPDDSDEWWNDESWDAWDAWDDWSGDWDDDGNGYDGLDDDGRYYECADDDVAAASNLATISRRDRIDANHGTACSDEEDAWWGDDDDRHAPGDDGEDDSDATAPPKKKPRVKRPSKDRWQLPAKKPGKYDARLRGRKAIAPKRAPRAVKRAIAAANRLTRKPYVWGGGHSGFIARGYDCSGAVSYVLHAIGKLNSPRVSGSLASWGKRGKGKWISVHANGGHVYMYIAGLRFDTSGRGESGPRWRAEPRSNKGFKIRHPAGL